MSVCACFVGLLSDESDVGKWCEGVTFDTMKHADDVLIWVIDRLSAGHRRFLIEFDELCDDEVGLLGKIALQMPTEARCTLLVNKIFENADTVCKLSGMPFVWEPMLAISVPAYDASICNRFGGRGLTFVVCCRYLNDVERWSMGLNEDANMRVRNVKHFMQSAVCKCRTFGDALHRVESVAPFQDCMVEFLTSRVVNVGVEMPMYLQQ